MTQSLSVGEWYHDTTSEWTLDYPPFFAYFEYVLGMFVPNKDMLVVQSEPYVSETARWFQRTTVIVTDAVLFAGVLAYAGTWSAKDTLDRKWSRRKVIITVFLTLFNPALLIVDHVHFQYNGMLVGLLLLSISAIRARRDCLAAATYASLVMFKHLFVVCAPIYFVYMLRHYCFVPHTSKATSRNVHDDQNLLPRRRRFSIVRFSHMALIVLTVVSLALGPVLLAGGYDGDSILNETKQLLSRLFPWNRGLVHAYWAPNVWALYSAADKVLATIARRLFRSTASASSSLTSGIVGDCAFAILPSVSAATTNVLMLTSMMPVLIKMWIRPHPKLFLSALAYVYFCYFMLGFHVHEKAIIIVISLLAMNASESTRDAALYMRTCFVGTACLFPLLFEIRETPTKCLLLLTFCSFVVVLDDYVRCSQSARRIRTHGVTPTRMDVASIIALTFAFVFDDLGVKNALLGSERMQFLPLMLYSLFGACALIPVWYETYTSFESRFRYVGEIYMARAGA